MEQKPDAEPDAGPSAEPGAGPEAAGDAQPDARYLLANERTYLAWTRTCLAFLVGGVALGQLSVRSGLEWLRTAIVLLVFVSGIVLTPLAFLHWRTAERAIRTGTALPRHVLPFVLMVLMVAVGLALAVLLVCS
ncbi:YidH family protein [Actinomadura oligospora]|uniref:YidH family protein n=1 Tax=Actinomadura oligospora TaxID=111804 RepID=UPI0004B57E8F|nr:DUF202 domain-containing protein [Actinomadura oligospora]